MMKIILPLLMLVIGGGAGVGAGLFLRPAPETAEMAGDAEQAMQDKKMAEQAKDSDDDGEDLSQYEYLKMSNQFVIPVINGDTVASLVVLSLSLEVPAGQQQAVFSREPKLRDSFLQVMFDHANVGGFGGAFTNPSNLDVLRDALREVAARDMDDLVSDVLITEIARQDY
jgi:hypothetical protein